MKKSEQSKPKQAWTTPQLQVYGDVAEVTRARYKRIGSADGIILIPDIALDDLGY
jgi:hypothetical protein